MFYYESIKQQLVNSKNCLCNEDQKANIYVLWQYDLQNIFHKNIWNFSKTVNKEKVQHWILVPLTLQTSKKIINVN